MNEMVYCIPTTLIDAYRGRSVIVRAPDADTLMRRLPPEGFDGLEYVRLRFLAGDADALRNWGPSVPLDLVLSDPAAQFPELYKWADLLETRPMRVSLPTAPGFSKATRLAASLRFDVKLLPGQPDDAAVAEMVDVLDLYLHDTRVDQPIEFFHTVLMAFCHERPASLWRIQEEDPAEFRDVRDDGTEALPGRLAGLVAPDPPGQCVDTFEQSQLARGAECAECEFRPVCRGYFKAPAPDYGCAAIRRVFTGLKLAAAELRRDIEACRKPDLESGS
jgi:hypothetical protein